VKDAGVNIVVGYIFGTEAEAALERAIVEARLRNARLIVVHSGKGGLEETDDEVLEYSNALARIDDDLTLAGVDHEVQEFILGHEPAEDVIRIAREQRADMIVVGLHRRSRVGKFLLGSTAQDIILGADCPVLAVKSSKRR
jgi:nucleotide-binding universal stress UspA family protein